MNASLKALLNEQYKLVAELREENKRLEEENKKLKEFKTKREESRFYFKAQMERAEPKTASEAEDLQKAKEMFEKLYRQELNCLEEENKTLKDNVEFLHSCLDDRDKSIVIMQEENKKLTKCNLNLQEWLDNKEKVNKSLREELEKLKSTYVYDAKQVREIC